MPNVAFILGAGASQRAGAPLMKDFLPRIREVMRVLPPRHALANQFQIFWQAYSALMPVHARAQVDYRNNIEEVFASFEMASLFSRLPSVPISKVRKLIAATRRVISATIEQSMPFDVKASKPEPHEDYRLLSTLLARLLKSPEYAPAVISFNYDVGLDYALTSLQIPYDYAINDSPAPGALPYYKLHGSLNWAYCPSARSRRAPIIPYDLQVYRDKYRKSFRSLTQASLGVSDHLQDLSPDIKCHAPEPFLVPPTWSKAQYQNRIGSLWARASQAISSASIIIMIGYSLSPLDQFFRHFFALSLLGDELQTMVMMIDPSEAPFSRLSELSGPHIRDALVHIKATLFESFNEEGLYSAFPAL
jgi:hypothetical protein